MSDPMNTLLKSIVRPVFTNTVTEQRSQHAYAPQ